MEGILKKNPGGIGIVEPLKCGELVELCQVFFGMEIARARIVPKTHNLIELCQVFTYSLVGFGVMSSFYLLTSR